MSQSVSNLEFKWHTWHLIVFLEILGTFELIAVVQGLARIAKEDDVGLLPYYLAFSSPFLIFLSVYLVYSKNSWVLLTFAILSVRVYLIALLYSPDLTTPTGSTLFYFLKSLPWWPDHFVAMFFFGSLIYSAFLKKWGQIE